MVLVGGNGSSTLPDRVSPVRLSIFILTLTVVVTSVLAQNPAPSIAPSSCIPGIVTCCISTYGTLTNFYVNEVDLISEVTPQSAFANANVPKFISFPEPSQNVALGVSADRGESTLERFGILTLSCTCTRKASVWNDVATMSNGWRQIPPIESGPKVVLPESWWVFGTPSIITDSGPSLMFNDVAMCGIPSKPSLRMELTRNNSLLGMWAIRKDVTNNCEIHSPTVSHTREGPLGTLALSKLSRNPPTSKLYDNLSLAPSTAPPTIPMSSRRALSSSSSPSISPSATPSTNTMSPSTRGPSLSPTITEATGSPSSAPSCYRPLLMDIVWVLDGSSSMLASDSGMVEYEVPVVTRFDYLRQFIVDYSLTLPLDSHDIRQAFVVFSGLFNGPSNDDPDSKIIGQVLNLTDSAASNVSLFIQEALGLQPLGFSTDTPAALDYVSQNILGTANRRPGSFRIIILATDGFPTDPSDGIVDPVRANQTEQKALNIRDADDAIFVFLKVGDDYPANWFNQIADKVYEVASFAALNTLLSNEGFLCLNLSHEPTASPSEAPSRSPTSRPSLTPSSIPSQGPSRMPTTTAPSMAPTLSPSTSLPSPSPSTSPSSSPSLSPSLLPTSIPSSTPTCYQPALMDILWVIDGSSSMAATELPFDYENPSPSQFQYVQLFIMQYTATVHMGGNGVRQGFVVFSGLLDGPINFDPDSRIIGQTLGFNESASENKTEFLQRVWDLHLIGYSTDTPAALDYVGANMLGSESRRPGGFRVIILATDGYPTNSQDGLDDPVRANQTEAKASQLRQDEDAIFIFLKIGTSYPPDWFQQIADRVYEVASFSALSDLLNSGEFLCLSLSHRPSFSPSASPSQAPSSSPSISPSVSVAPSLEPQSVSPSAAPSSIPTISQQSPPSTSPSRTPSQAPSATSILSPSRTPSQAPSATFGTSPSRAPSQAPSSTPSTSPSRTPSHAPSDTSILSPSRSPSKSPSATPSKVPSRTPSHAPSQATVATPTPITTKPSKSPSTSPIKAPSISPSLAPITKSPTHTPNSGGGGGSERPSKAPSKAPTGSPQVILYLREGDQEGWDLFKAAFVGNLFCNVPDWACGACGLTDPQRRVTCEPSGVTSRVPPSRGRFPASHAGSILLESNVSFSMPRRGLQDILYVEVRITRIVMRNSDLRGPLPLPVLRNNLTALQILDLTNENTNVSPNLLTYDGDCLPYIECSNGVLTCYLPPSLPPLCSDPGGGGGIIIIVVIAFLLFWLLGCCGCCLFLCICVVGRRRRRDTSDSDKDEPIGASGKGAFVTRGRRSTNMSRKSTASTLVGRKASSFTLRRKSSAASRPGGTRDGNWQEGFDVQSGTKFWINLVTGDFSWDNPEGNGHADDGGAGVQAVASGKQNPALGSREAPMDEEWEKVRDNATDTYYYVNRKTHEFSTSPLGSSEYRAPSDAEFTNHPSPYQGRSSLTGAVGPIAAIRRTLTGRDKSKLLDPDVHDVEENDNPLTDDEEDLSVPSRDPRGSGASARLSLASHRSGSVASGQSSRRRFPSEIQARRVTISDNPLFGGGVESSEIDSEQVVDGEPMPVPREINEGSAESDGTNEVDSESSIPPSENAARTNDELVDGDANAFPIVVSGAIAKDRRESDLSTDSERDENGKPIPGKLKQFESEQHAERVAHDVGRLPPEMIAVGFDEHRDPASRPELTVGRLQVADPAKNHTSQQQQVPAGRVPRVAFASDLEYSMSLKTSSSDHSMDSTKFAPEEDHNLIHPLAGSKLTDDGMTRQGASEESVSSDEENQVSLDDEHLSEAERAKRVIGKIVVPGRETPEEKARRQVGRLIIDEKYYSNDTRRGAGLVSSGIEASKSQEGMRGPFNHSATSESTMMAIEGGADQNSNVRPTGTGSPIGNLDSDGDEHNNDDDEEARARRNIGKLTIGPFETKNVERHQRTVGKLDLSKFQQFARASEPPRPYRGNRPQAAPIEAKPVFVPDPTAFDRRPQRKTFVANRSRFEPPGAPSSSLLPVQATPPSTPHPSPTMPNDQDTPPG